MIVKMVGKALAMLAVAAWFMPANVADAATTGGALPGTVVRASTGNGVSQAHVKVARHKHHKKHKKHKKAKKGSAKVKHAKAGVGRHKSAHAGLALHKGKKKPHKKDKVLTPAQKKLDGTN